MWKKAEKILKNNGIVVLPTDTLYGIVGSAFSRKAIERIYKIKERKKSKPFIVLFTDLEDLKKFKVSQEDVFKKNLSVILSSTCKRIKYIHRGTHKIAFRRIYKKNRNLYNLIKKVGPIVAPSANIQDLPPARNIIKAKKYFGNKVDLYISGGTLNKKASRVIEGKKIIRT
ncbi:MAG: Sua5/YciO/YrdC/YwlC family protein [Patescibacteria group bacterium]|nr:Sua5/YciO/YrdC/YwlC family protein [Patescibacteria group bacterium]